MPASQLEVSVPVPASSGQKAGRPPAGRVAGPNPSIHQCGVDEPANDGRRALVQTKRRDEGRKTLLTRQGESADLAARIGIPFDQCQASQL
jgi:hypothetical protein